MIQNKRVLAFIPAKTGSVGLPGKLFKKIGGYTLLEWTLYAAYKSKYIDEIIVSSNDLEIKKLVSSFVSNICFEYVLDKKIKFLQRPDNLCSPTSKTEDAVFHMFEADQSLKSYDHLIILQATSPARRNSLIDSCFNEFEKHSKSFPNKCSLITVEESTPFYWKYKDNDCSNGVPMYSLLDRPMRQELLKSDMMYKDNGNIYITDIQLFLTTKTRVSENAYLFLTNKFESMQVDTLEDFEIMSKLYEYYGGFL